MDFFFLLLFKGLSIFTIDCRAIDSLDLQINNAIRRLLNDIGSGVTKLDAELDKAARNKYMYAMLCYAMPCFDSHMLCSTDKEAQRRGDLLNTLIGR